VRVTATRKKLGIPHCRTGRDRGSLRSANGAGRRLILSIRLPCFPLGPGAVKRPGTLENSSQPRLVHSRPSGDVARAAALAVAGEDGFPRVGQRAESMAPGEACCRCPSMTDDENTARFRGKTSLPPTARVDSVLSAIGRSLHEWKAVRKATNAPNGF
jgi:hypothetical protein